MADHFSEVIKRITAEISDIAGLLWQKGWTEGKTGSISFWLKDIKAEELPSDYSPFFLPLAAPCPEMAKESFIVSAAGNRMRDLARQPMRNAVIIRITDDGTGYNIISHHGKTELRPSGDLLSHLRIFASTNARRQIRRAVIHAHVTEIIAMTQLYELCDDKRLNKILTGMLPGTKTMLHDGIGFLPYQFPEDEYASESLAGVFRKNEVAVLEKHGVYAAGESPGEALDVIETLSKAASVYLLSRSTGIEPEGLTSEHIEELDNLKI